MKKFPSQSSCRIIDRCCNTFWFVVRLLRMIAIYMNFYVLSEEYLQQSFGDVQCGGGRRGNWPSSVKTAKPAKNLSQNCILSLAIYWTSVKEALLIVILSYINMYTLGNQKVQRFVLLLMPSIWKHRGRGLQKSWF